MQTTRRGRRHAQEHEEGVVLAVFVAQSTARSYVGFTVLLLAVAMIVSVLTADEAQAQPQNVPINFVKAGEVTVKVESRNPNAAFTHEFGIKSPTNVVACKPCSPGDEASVGKVDRGEATFYLTATTPAGEISTFVSNDSEHARVTAVAVGVAVGSYRIEWEDFSDDNFIDLVVVVTLTPDPPPAPPQLYTLGTFNMAGGHKRYGDRPETAVALSRSIKDRAADIVFLQEACKNMTDKLKAELGPDWTVTLQPVPRRERDENLPADRDGGRNHRCKPGKPGGKGSVFGIGMVVRSSRLTVTRSRVYQLPLYEVREARRMLCLDIATPRPLVACSTHLTADDGTNEVESRRRQAEEIKNLLSPGNTADKAVFLGGDFNTTPDAPALNALWHPAYVGGAAGSFIEVDSGPSEQKISYQRITGRTTWSNVIRIRGGWSYTRERHKYDYIFVRDVNVLHADVGDSKFSDHKLLWATVVHRTAAAGAPPNT